MSSGFLLVETLPGREGSVLERLSRMPGVTQNSVLYPAAIAVKAEAARLDLLATSLRQLDGVVGARIYHSKRNA